MFVTKRNNNVESVKFDKITHRISKLIKENEKHILNPILVAQKVVVSIFSGITTEELDLESANICANLSTSNYLYSLLAGRILVSNLHKKLLNNNLNNFVDKMNLIQKELNLLDESWILWINEVKNDLNSIIDYNKDYLFDYFGFKTLERAYLIKNDKHIFETPQDMFLRVASFINKGNLENTKKTYNLMSLGYYTHASPTLFNSANKNSQLSSCFLLGTEDSLDGIVKTWADVSKISKYGGGIGLHVSNIRAKDSIIRGTNGPSSGIIPMLKVYNEIARYVDQCFIGSTKIYTNNGLIEIEKIKPNDKVFTIDGTLQDVERIYCDIYKGIIINLYIENDYENIKVTPSHPFYVIKNESLDNELIKNRLKNDLINPEWISAIDINNNDLIGIPIPKYNLDNNNYGEDDCYMYGLLIGNNLKINLNSYEIMLNNNEFINKYFKINNINYEQDNNIIKWYITSKFKFVKSQFYDDNNNKFIDNSILNLPENKLRWIIKGILDDNIEINCNIVYKSFNKKIIDGLKYMLLKMGILCCGNTLNDQYTLLIPKIDKITCLFDIENTDNINYIEHNNILYTKCINKYNENIETIVYDLEVKNNHNYLTQAGLVHNGGKRKGSIAIYLEPHHPDILAFLELRKNYGAETERTRDLFTALWISDLFMKQVENDDEWYLMCPDECKNLSDLYGEEYEKLYWSYVNQEKYKTKIKARKIFDALMDSQLETGTPYITFKDSVNKKSNQMNIGTIKSSNLCNEIVEYSDHSEYAVCNLASIALNKFVDKKIIDTNSKWTIYTKNNCKYCEWAKKYIEINNYNAIIKDKLDDVILNLNIKNLTFPQILLDDKYIGGWNELYNFMKGTFNFDKLYQVAYDATINLNKIIDINFYPVPETKKSNFRHRPIGLGIQGLADTLVLLKITFDSDEALEFNSKMMETIYLASISASCDISKDREQGMKRLILKYNEGFEFPFYYDKTIILEDTELNEIYHEIKPNYYELNNKISTFCGSYSTFEGSPFSFGKFQFDMWDNIKLHYKDKWDELKEKVIKFGVRNSLLTALMPTASTSQILGNNECFEFFTSNIYTRKTLAGTFSIVNKYLIDDLTSIGLWSDEMKQLIIANNGSIANFNNIPEQIKNLYQTIWEIKQIWVLKAALARAPFVDQTQSMNIFMAVPNYQKLYSCHMWAWKNGLKTGIYYLRSKPSTEAIKVTVDPTVEKKLKLITDVCENCSA